MYTFMECNLNDIIPLKHISCKTYKETFANMNTEANISTYLENAFNLDTLRIELQDSNSSFYFLYYNDILSGYIKLNESQAQTDIKDSDSIELQRIYVLKDFQGKGLGRCLLNKAIETATLREKKYIWLGVWEENHKAMQFYKNAGFYKIGEHPFVMGDEEQTDYILRKDL